MKIKLWISIVLAFFAFVFITQNTETVDVRFLVWSVEMSLVLLVFIMLVAGLIIGWLLNSYLRFSAKKNREKSSAEMSVTDKAASARDVVNDSSNDEEKDYQ